MFLVAAAGGGARAAYWTASVLGAIQDSQPDFARQLFAVSAVSGGALGGAAFATLGADPPTCRIERKESRSFRECLAEFLSYDFLSPVMASYLTADLVNRFVPLERFLADRAEALELSWERAWDNTISGPNWMRAPFDERWTDRKFQINLLLNGTIADAGVRSRAGDPPTLRPGERAVTSNLKLIDQTGVTIPNPASYSRLSLSTAIDNSTRFPFVEPVGGVTPHLDSRTNNTALSTYYLADGGYYDNYGAATLLDLIHMLENQWSTLNIDKLVIIQISSNSEISSKLDGENTPSKPSPLPMTAGPIVACRGWSEPPGSAGEALTAYHTAEAAREWSGLGYALQLLALDQQRIVLGRPPGTDNPPVFYFHFGMHDIDPPLGWSLARQSRGCISDLLGEGSYAAQKIERLKGLF
jgi:hypothetical protein